MKFWAWWIMSFEIYIGALRCQLIVWCCIELYSGYTRTGSAQDHHS